MSNLKSAWKYKIEIKDIFDEKFLLEKDIALQPISFIYENENNNIKKPKKKKKSLSNRNSITINNKKEEDKEEKDLKSQRNSIRKSLKKYESFSSNIVIVQSITDGGSQDSSVDQIGKEVEKLKKLMKRSKTKFSKKRRSKSKGLKSARSTKY